MTYTLERREIIPATLDEVFAFFKNPYNLEALTPPWLAFRIVSTSDREVTVGTEISYQLRLHGVRLNWRSRITEYVEGVLFADEQLSGPYRRWYHRHLFHPVAGGVEMTDVVEYALPFGMLGRIVHALVVRRQLQQIFDYRTRAMLAHFSSARASRTTTVGVAP